MPYSVLRRGAWESSAEVVVGAEVKHGNGHSAGLRAAVTLLIDQADDFGIPRVEVGIDPQLRTKQDLNLDPPPGYFAG